MKFKKTISAALAMATLMSSTSIVSYAAEDAAMKQALTYVKQRIEIPEELKDFQHSSSVYNNRNRYSFTWSKNDEKSSEELNVTICGKVITRYNFYSYEYGDVDVDDILNKDLYSFGKLSREELVSKAKKWVKKLNPTVYNDIEILDDSLNVSIMGSNARLSLRRTKNGIPVNGQNGSITIDKDTGELISFNITWTMGATFANPDKAVSEETAEDGFTEEFPIDLVYTTEYDWETDTYTPHLIYRQTKFGQIDALTGKLSTFEDYVIYDEGDADVEEDCDDDVAFDTANPSTGGVNFTEAEIEKMEKEDSLIKADEALEMLKEMGIFLLGDNPEVSRSNCSYDKKKDLYTRTVSFSSEDKNYYPVGDYPVMPAYEDDVVEEVDEVDVADDVDDEITDDRSVYGSFRINAETGEILHFNSYGYYPNNPETALSEKKSLKKIKSSLKKLIGDKYDEFKITEPNYFYSDYDKQGNPAKNAFIVEAYADSPRYVYDIPSNSENVSISINSEGKVTNFSMNYYGIEYPKPENIITAEQAYDSYFEQIDHKLQYRLAIKEKKTLSALVYNTSDRLYIDAFSGKLTNYNGVEYVETYTGGYTDLEDSEYREIAEKLAEYGITLMDEGGKLNADEYITRDAFTVLARNIGAYYHNSTGGEKALTRQFAAKVLTSEIISTKCAELKGIFKSPFSDVKDTNSYVGYIAVANATGIMEGKDGKFRPSQKITRGEALKMIYDFLAE
ncbi:MAG: S-layer homology domain-containing protein [Ruminiclostridium sp.]|nr:S-layer homology domain-containing protein [Ruminiclostridium sp.]